MELRKCQTHNPHELRTLSNAIQCTSVSTSTFVMLHLRIYLAASPGGPFSVFTFSPLVVLDKPRQQHSERESRDLSLPPKRQGRKVITTIKEGGSQHTYTQVLIHATLQDSEKARHSAVRFLRLLVVGNGPLSSADPNLPT